MGKIRQLREDQLINGGSQEHIYPITHARAVYFKDKRNLQDTLESMRDGNFLEDGSIKTRHLNDEAVTTSKLGDGSVTTPKISDGNVTTEKIANESITTPKIGSKAVTVEKLAEDSVTTDKIKDESVTEDKLAESSVGTSKIKDGAVTNDKVANDSLTRDKLDPELRNTLDAATGLPEDLMETIQNVDKTLKDHQSQLDDKQSQIDDKQKQITANDDDISLLQTRSTQMEEAIKGISASGGASQASAVTYENTESGLDSVTAQGAIDELAEKNKAQDIAVASKNSEQDAEISKKANSADVDSQIQAEQERVNAELDKKFNKENIAQEFGDSEDKVVSQFALPFREIESSEFIKAIVDAENHFLLGIQLDGSIEWGKGIPAPIRVKLQEIINQCQQDKTDILETINATKEELSVSIAALQEGKVDKEKGKSLIEDEVKECFRIIENEEFLKAIVDSDDKVLFGFYRATGEPYYPLNEMYHVIQNEEYFAAWVTTDEKIVLGIRRDGEIIGEIHAVNALKQVVSDLQEKVDTMDSSLKELLDVFSMQENPEYLAVEKDADGRILSATYNNGSHYVHNLKSETFDTKVDKEEGKTLINEDVANSKTSIEDQEERMELTTDSDNKILGYREKDGTKVEKKMRVTSLHVEDGNDFIKYLKGKGYNINACDMSDEGYIRIPNQPRKAIVNISGVSSMPTSKTQNLQAWMEVWTLEGIYFKKRVILNAQGSSSLYLAKKNFAVDICNDEWIGDDTCKVKIGNWVSQDSFHFKAYYTDAFRGAGAVCYKLFDEISKSRGLHNDRAYKRYYKDSTSASYGINQNAEIAYDFGDEARTFPDGFPCIVYFKGEFLGVFSWQLKKHRDNMKMSKSKAENIHLDGFIRQNLFSANGTLPSTAWNPMSEQGFEVRNPKSLICMDGSKYDADKNKVQELIDDTSESYDASNKNMKLSFQVKKYIIALSKYDTELTEVETQIETGSKTKDDIKKEIDKRYDVDGIIDYLCFSNVIANYDGFGKNWQIGSWNGVRFGVYPYDLDGVFGDFFDGTFSFSPKDNFMEPISLMGNKKGYGGTYWVYKYFATELKNRYSELRKAILTTDNIINLLTDWCSRIGTDDFKQEYDRWKQSPCHRDSNINTEYYTPCSYTDAGITASGQKVWDKDTTYTAGSYVVFEHLAFKVIKDCTNVSPVTEYYSERPFYLGHYDSIYRVKKWLEERLPLVDNLINSLT